MEETMIEILAKSTNDGAGEYTSLADLFLQTSRELAQSDAKMFRSIDRHLKQTKEILRRAEVESEIPSLASTDQDNGAGLVGPPSFERQPRKSLEALCRQHGIRGYSRMSKTLMIARLRDAGVEDPPVPIEAFSKPELLSLLHKILKPISPHD